MSPDDLDGEERDTVPVDVDEDFYQKWRDAKKAKDEAEAVFADLDDELRNRVRDASDGCDARIVVEGQPVGRYIQYKSSYFDRSTFKRQFPDIYNQFTHDRLHWRLSWARGDR